MANHDYSLDNQAGASFRADINAVLQAIVTNNSSATEPTTTFPNMWWYDTANAQLKRRNNANDAWIVLGLEAADTDGTLAANSDAKVATQKATKTYVDNKTIAENRLSLSDNTTANASTSAHGLLKKLSNVATEFMNGVGNWVAITIDSILPTQTGNSGKFLTTNGSASSWASVVQGLSNVKVGSITRDTNTASGNVSYTGLGFTPKAIIFILGVESDISESVGFSSGSSENFCVGSSRTTGISYFNDPYAISFYSSGTIRSHATIASFDADGFTLSWTRDNSVTGTITIGYLAIR